MDFVCRYSKYSSVFRFVFFFIYLRVRVGLLERGRVRMKMFLHTMYSVGMRSVQNSNYLSSDSNNIISNTHSNERFTEDDLPYAYIRINRRMRPTRKKKKKRGEPMKDYEKQYVVCPSN